VGVVGLLQLDVLRVRMKGEYGVDIQMDPQPFRFVRWIAAGPVAGLNLTSTTRYAKDREERPVLLFENEWSIRWALENNAGLVLKDTASRNTEETYGSR